jgi:hypothetical protein
MKSNASLLYFSLGFSAALPDFAKHINLLNQLPRLQLIMNNNNNNNYRRV